MYEVIVENNPLLIFQRNCFHLIFYENSPLYISHHTIMHIYVCVIKEYEIECMVNKDSILHDRGEGSH